MASAKFYGTGRRKKSIARVYLTPGTGKITINKRDIDEYFGLETLKVIVRQPLAATETDGKFDVLVNVKGGGYTGQAGAIRHGVASVLRGKNKPQFTPHVDTGDYVIVVNADKIKVTGKKMDQKIYYHHSDYVGGMKETTLKEMMAKKPEKVIELAVKGMLPK